MLETVALLLAIGVAVACGISLIFAYAKLRRNDNQIIWIYQKMIPIAMKQSDTQTPWDVDKLFRRCSDIDATRPLFTVALNRLVEAGVLCDMDDAMGWVDFSDHMPYGPSENRKGG